MRIVRTDSPQTARDAVTSRILRQIGLGLPVLLLASGGSTAGIAVGVCEDAKRLIGRGATPLSESLSLSLIDERFGPAGHGDSNWQRLIDLGLDECSVNARPVLVDREIRENSFTAAIDAFDGFLKGAVARQKAERLYIVGLFGIGSDGHTAGILPGSPLSVETAEDEGRFAAGYVTDRFTRITVAPPFFRYIDYAVAYAAGSEKRAALATLEREAPIAAQPAQLLKRARETVVFTDALPNE